MKFTQNEKLTIDSLRNLANGSLNTTEVNDFFKSLMKIVLLNFAENESTEIPYFGKISVIYKGDICGVNGRVADVDVKFEPSDYFVKNIGQLIDAKNPNSDAKITDMDCISDTIKNIRNKLNSVLKQEF